MAKELPEDGLVLEIASGSGEHAIHFARQFANLDWQPSDREAESLASIEAWRIESGAENLRPAVLLDAASGEWPIELVDAIVCINMVHISPWAATEGLFSGASKSLAAGAPLLLYGPYAETGVAMAETNVAFDLSLRERNPEWGLRRVEDLDELSSGTDLVRTARYEMPANNLALIYRRR